MWLGTLSQNRGFQDVLPPTDVEFKPANYSHTAVGGPHTAEIRAVGPERDLWQLLDWLGYPQWIYDQQKRAVWWGFVNEVELAIKNIKIGVSLSHMSNVVYVTYVRDRKSRTTAPAEDDDSISTYGRKEVLLPFIGSNADQAAQYAATQLQKRAKPVPIPSKGPRQSTDTAFAVLRCLGWRHKLDWMYLEQLAGEEHQRRTGPDSQEFGWPKYMQKVAQSFMLEGSRPWQAERIAVRLFYDHDDDAERPTDNVLVDLCADSGNNPGAVLATGTILRSQILNSANWNTATLPSPVTLQPATRYWIVVRRAGTLEEERFYRVGVHEDMPYDRGVLVIYDPGDPTATPPQAPAWRTRAEFQSIDERTYGLKPQDWRNNADLSFQVIGAAETTDQLDWIVDDVASTYVSRFEVEAASGVRTNPRREGRNTAWDEIVELLEVGDNNNARLLASIRADLSFYVYPEPTQTDITAYLTYEGELVYPAGGKVPLHTCPVGIWTQLRDDLGVVERGSLAEVLPLFIEESRWDAQRNEWTFQARGVESVWSLSPVREG